MSGQRELSEGGRMVLAEIPRFVLMWGYAPSVRDLGTALGIAGSSVWHHLGHLKEAELVTWDPGCARTIRLTKQGEQAVSNG